MDIKPSTLNKLAFALGLTAEGCGAINLELVDVQDCATDSGKRSFSSLDEMLNAVLTKGDGCAFKLRVAGLSGGGGSTTDTNTYDRVSVTQNQDGSTSITVTPWDGVTNAATGAPVTTTLPSPTVDTDTYINLIKGVDEDGNQTITCQSWDALTNTATVGSSPTVVTIPAPLTDTDTYINITEGTDSSGNVTLTFQSWDAITNSATTGSTPTTVTIPSGTVDTDTYIKIDKGVDSNGNQTLTCTPWNGITNTATAAPEVMTIEKDGNHQSIDQQGGDLPDPIPTDPTGYIGVPISGDTASIVYDDAVVHYTYDGANWSNFVEGRCCTPETDVMFSIEDEDARVFDVSNTNTISLNRTLHVRNTDGDIRVSHADSSQIAGDLASVTTPHDKVVIGSASSTASGVRSTAFAGINNTVSGNDSHVSGNNNTVSGNRSSASGTANDVSGINSTATGQNNNISGNNSLSTGLNNVVPGRTALVGGFGNTVDENLIGSDCGHNASYLNDEFQCMMCGVFNHEIIEDEQDEQVANGGGDKKSSSEILKN